MRSNQQGSDMNAILVSVNYSDILCLTLNYNRHHFNSVMVVTDDADNADACVAREHKAEVFATRAFYDGGASFAKWKALEQGLDAFGRDGWLCIMDGDVLWPKKIDWNPDGNYQYGCVDESTEAIIDCDDMSWERYSVLKFGNLYSPFRRMWENWPSVPAGTLIEQRVYEDYSSVLPVESEWKKFPLHRQQHEHAGFTQIFNASDPVLGPPPWHDTSYSHCGAADSWFQQKWSADKKIRPTWEVLHLGPAGTNWYGRATMRADGSVPEGANEKAKMTADMWRLRSERRKQGLDPFELEKIKEN